MNVFQCITNRKIHILIILLCTLFAYSNIFQNAFVGDDSAFISSWDEVKNFDLRSLLSGNLPPNQAGVYRPLRSLFYAVYYQFWKDNPVGYHAHSLVVHLISTVLVYLIVSQIGQIRRIGQIGNVSFVTALLFGLHPVHTESITYISASFDTTAAVFFFASFYWYIKSQQQFRHYIVSVTCAFIGVFIHEITLTLPLLLIMYRYCFLVGSKRTKTKEFFTSWWGLAPYVILVPLYFAIRVFILHLPLSRGHYFADNAVQTMVMMIKVFGHYIGLLIFPLKLAFVHTVAYGLESYLIPYSHFEQFLQKRLWDVDIFVPLLLLGALLVVAIVAWRKNPLITFCIAWFFLTMLPVANIIPIGPLLAERYLYIASFGYVFLIGYFFNQLLHSRSRLGVGLLLVGIVGFYFLKTYQRNADWRNITTLWSSVLSIYPSSLIAHFNLSGAYRLDNRLDKAMEEDNKILGIEPKFWEVSFNLANSYYQLRAIDLAKKEYQRVLAINPEFIEAYFNLANIYYREGERQAALATVSRALVINPREYKVFNNYKSEQEVMSKIAQILSLRAGIAKDLKQDDIALASTIDGLNIDSKDTHAAMIRDDLLHTHPDWKIAYQLEPVFAGWKTYHGLTLNFRYPPDWSVKTENSAITMNDYSGKFSIDVHIEQFNSSKEDVIAKLANPTLGTIQRSGNALIPTVDQAYVTIYSREDRTMHQFLLFNNNRVAEIRVYPSDAYLMKEFNTMMATFTF